MPRFEYVFRVMELWEPVTVAVLAPPDDDGIVETAQPANRMHVKRGARSFIFLSNVKMHAPAPIPEVDEQLRSCCGLRDMTCWPLAWLDDELEIIVRHKLLWYWWVRVEFLLNLVWLKTLKLLPEV